MRKSALIAAIVTALFVVPVAVYAGHQFNDVPNSHTFHNAIAWMANNGITVGCNDAGDEYCPDDPVTRGQMSAFMKRLAEFQVVDAGTLEGKSSSDFLEAGTIVTTTGGSGWLPHDSDPTTIRRFVSYTSFSGDGSAVLPLSAATQFDTTAYGLQEFELCYVPSLGGTITAVSVYRTEEGGTTDTEIYGDPTDRTESGCTTHTVNRSVGAGAAIYVGLTNGGFVNLMSVKATWSEAANG